MEVISPLSLEGEGLRKHIASEWLETNCFGSYSSSSISGAHSRRYHGLFVVSRPGTLGRDVLLSRLDESLKTKNGSIELATRSYRDTTYPDGSSYCSQFKKELHPTTIYSSGGAEGVEPFEIHRSVLLLNAENTLLIRYEVKSCPEDALLQLEPFVANRFFHGLKTSSYSAIDRHDWNRKRLLIVPSGEQSPYSILIPKGSFDYQPDWFFKFYYSHEHERGQGADEDLFRLGVIDIPICEGETLFLAVSTLQARWEQQEDLSLLWQAECDRRKAIISSSPKESSFKAHLALAADAFCIEQQDSNQERRDSIVAGYHWFSDWGRDTMISLPGLCLRSGKSAVTKRILTTFADNIKDGLIPNRFSDVDGEAEYNSVDASLWFIVNGYRCLHQLEDLEFVASTFLPACQQILKAFSEGTKYNIYQADDGLLSAGEGDDQLTWMDARVGDWVVTPRHGKPVEVNALWCNAHYCVSLMLEMLDKHENAKQLYSKAEQLKKVFEATFWNEKLGALYDVVMEGGADDCIRPNQVFALSLPFELLEKKKAFSVLQCVERELLTPRGLRTLSPSHPDYRGRYCGSVLERDGAYHQGTVWPWLLGAYSRAVVRYGSADMKQRALEIFYGFEDHLYEHGIGHISEIFDGDSPHTPRGCIAQAWSVAELLCAMEVLEGESVLV